LARHSTRYRSTLRASFGAADCAISFFGAGTAVGGRASIVQLAFIQAQRGEEQRRDMAAKRSILCVDDDEDTLFITTLSLELDDDIRVTKSSRGTDAMAILAGSGSQIDCIILDVRMPDMSGPDLLAAIRTLPAHRETPVIFLTAGIRDGDADRYGALGASGLLSKPYDPLTLAADVRRILAAA
jgi:two-component system OmpR family response regulator